jgi:hypothetical protein
MKKILLFVAFYLSLTYILFAQEGFGTNAPKSTVDIIGSFGAAYRETSANTILDDKDYVVMVTGAGGITLTLPAASSSKNRTYIINNATGSNVFYTPSPWVTDLGLGGTRNVIYAKTNDVIQSDGTKWVILNSGVSNNLYNIDGTLTANRTVTQTDKNLNFTSTAATGTSHFTVDGTTLNVDAVNNRVGIGTAAPVNTLEVKSAAAGTSGLTLSNLPNANYLATDATGKVIVAGESETAGVLVNKQRLIAASNANIVTSASGAYSFRYSTNVTAGFWQIRYNGTGTRSIATFITEHWVPTGYSVAASSGTLTAGSWVNIPGSTNVGSANELNIYRIYDLIDGTTFRFEGNLINSGGLKESMILEQF